MHSSACLTSLSDGKIDGYLHALPEAQTTRSVSHLKRTFAVDVSVNIRQADLFERSDVGQIYKIVPSKYAIVFYI